MSHSFRCRRAALLLLSLTSLPSLPIMAQEPPPATQPAPPPPPKKAPVPALPPELARIEKIEAVTTAFSQALLDFGRSLETGGDRAATLTWLEPRLSFRPFPSRPGAASALRKDIERRPWVVEGDLREGSREDFLQSLDAFLANFRQVELVRLDVLGSEVRQIDAPAALDATVHLSVRGRNARGQREWAQGEARLSGHQAADGAWRITSFAVNALESLASGRDLFTEVSQPAGVAATDIPLMEAFRKGTPNPPTGAAAIDIDQDGLVDLFATGSAGNPLYLNQGDGTFREAGAPAGLKGLLPDKVEYNPVFLDYDNDGDADLFVTLEPGAALFENRLVPDGRLSFRDASAGLPQFPEYSSFGVAVGDVNGDALPDIYVCHYASRRRGPKTTVDDLEGDPNLLYVNQGGGIFKEEARERGVADTRFSVAAQFADLDGDGDLDLYVANDFGGGNGLFINDGTGHFTDQAQERGASLAAASMGVSLADYDNDGQLDLHVTNMSSVAASRTLARFPPGALKKRDLLERQWSGNALLRNQGGGRFLDVTPEAGPFLAEWAWGGGFLDVDNDGWMDLFTPNGLFSGKKPQDERSLVFTRIILAMQEEERDRSAAMIQEALGKMGGVVAQKGHSYAGWDSSRMYLNRDGGRFLEITGISGADALPSDVRATVYADFDNDGDQDIFLRAIHGKSHFLFRNETGQDNSFLRVAVEGRASGRDAFGTLVKVKTGKLTLTRLKQSNNGFLDQADPRLLFGLGAAKAVGSIEVRWPSGRTQTFRGPFAAGSSLRLVEGESKPVKVEEKRFRLPDPQ